MVKLSLLFVTIFISAFVFEIAQSTEDIKKTLPTIKTENNKELSRLTMREKSAKKIMEDEIFGQISNDFATNLVFMKENRIRVTLRITDAKYQQFVINKTVNMLAAVIEGYLALVIDEHVDGYDYIEILFYDMQGAKFDRKIFVKEDVEKLKLAGYSRETFKVIYL